MTDLTAPQLSDVERVVDFCSRLVQVPSLSGREGDAADLVEAEMKALGLEDVRRDAYGNVTGICRGAHPGPTLMFDAHMDVVAVKTPLEWHYPPFGGEINGGKLWGRGATDTKGSLAAMLYAAALATKADLHGQVVVAATVCEENVTGSAVAHVLDDFDVDVLVTGEPSGLKLLTAQKGRFALSLAAHGRSAHTSRPELGDNAIYKMMEAVDRLRAQPQPVDPELGASVLELIEIISQPYPNGDSVPYGCSARLIGRFIPDQSRAQILSNIHQALGDLEGIQVELAYLSQTSYTGKPLDMEDFIPGWRNNPDNPWQVKIIEALRQAGLPAHTGGAPFGTNASASAARGITSFIYGPGTVAQAHIVDEWIDLNDLENGFKGFGAIVCACLSPTRLPAERRA